MNNISGNDVFEVLKLNNEKNEKLDAAVKQEVLQMVEMFK